MTPIESYQFGLFPLVLWREARNQSYDTMLAVAYSIMNRVEHPSWWGNDLPSVILKHNQYSSFNWNDLNSQKFPNINDPSFKKCLDAAYDVFINAIPDTTNGATNYYDDSIRTPLWAKDMEFTVKIGPFNFYKERTSP